MELPATLAIWAAEVEPVVGVDYTWTPGEEGDRLQPASDPEAEITGLWVRFQHPVTKKYHDAIVPIDCLDPGIVDAILDYVFSHHQED